jgi:hypothetical protein
VAATALFHERNGDFSEAKGVKEGCASGSYDRLESVDIETGDAPRQAEENEDRGLQRFCLYRSGLQHFPLKTRWSGEFVFAEGWLLLVPPKHACANQRGQT